MSKLKIKGLGWVEYEGKSLSKIKADLDNPNVPRDTEINLPGFFRGPLGDIQSIWEGGESQIQSRAKKPHWVILNPQRNCIWKTTYLSLEEADAEKEFSGLSSDWVVRKAE